jgi:2-dehydro-3-deoxyphosphooctonate aldolase (KDO 8-P synthase)
MQQVRKIKVGDIVIGGPKMVFVAGPCVIESEEHLLMVAGRAAEICTRLDLPYIIKTSFDKANRTSINSYRGPGLERGLEIIRRVKERLGVPVLCDIHLPEQAEKAAPVIDALQIPAFLCRQTDLLLAAARTGRPVNVKKGQFLAPEDMGQVVEKIRSTGNEDIILTERGTMFGYHNLVVDMRSLVVMRSFGYPVMFDATHSLQLPAACGTHSGGQREFIAPLARAAAAVGIDALFMEIHDQPECAPCDGANMLPLDSVEPLLSSVKQIRA